MRYALLTIALLIALPALALDYLGTETQWTWDQPGDFPVTEWAVYVGRNGADPVQEQTVTEQLVTVTGEVGETLTVQVQAINGIHESELSEMSEAVTLRVMPQPGGVALYCEGGLIEVAPGWWSCPGG